MNVRKENIAVRIRQALYVRRLRPAELALLTGVSRASVSQWLRGENLSVSNLSSIAEALDFSLNWLVLGIGHTNLAKEADLSIAEEDIIRIIRHFGHDSIQPIINMIDALRSDKLPAMKQFKAYDLVSHIGMAISVLDEQGNLLFSNIHHNKLLGLDGHNSHSLLGKHFTEWIPRLYHRKIRNILQDALRKGHASYNKLHLTCPVTGQLRQMIVHARAISTRSGPAVQMLVHTIDHDNID